MQGYVLHRDERIQIMRFYWTKGWEIMIQRRGVKGRIWSPHHRWIPYCHTNSPFYSCVLGCQAFEQEWG